MSRLKATVKFMLNHVGSDKDFDVMSHWEHDTVGGFFTILFDKQRTKFYERKIKGWNRIVSWHNLYHYLFKYGLEYKSAQAFIDEAIKQGYISRYDKGNGWAFKLSDAIL